LKKLDPDFPPTQLLEKAVEANGRWALRQLLESPEGKMRVAEGWMKLVGAIYDIKSGRVMFLK
jgi:carbonic anhydrase